MGQQVGISSFNPTAATVSRDAVHGSSRDRGVMGRKRHREATVTLDHLMTIDPNAVSFAGADRYGYFYLKRIIDLVLTAFALITLLPLMIIIAILICLDSSGPAIFVQKRVGARRRYYNGKPYWQRVEFNFYKFRSMRQNADTDLHEKFVAAYISGDTNKMAEIQPDEEKKGEFKLSRDPRVTKIGHFLRKTSLDELPQLWNVLQGDMSLVGPRPAIPYEVEQYQPWHMQRFATMPGITGPWQVSGRSQVTFDDMVRLDVRYTQTQSVWQDIGIILWTLPSAFIGKGAR
ncbi:MAG: sugar transferase [Chloroflexota bacterium]